MKPTYEDIVKNYINLVYFFAKKTLSNQSDIDDVVQETFLKAMKTYDRFTFKSEGELKSWLLTICRNVIMDGFRSHKNILPLEANDIDVSDNNSEKLLEEQIIQSQEVKRIKEVVKAMKPFEQELIRLRVFEEMEFNQIAIALDSKEAAVKMRYYRAIQKLKEELL
jgi:RNA polymerase sigma-70 factor, ECF subfamily